MKPKAGLCDNNFTDKDILNMRLLWQSNAKKHKLNIFNTQQLKFLIKKYKLNTQRLYEEMANYFEIEDIDNQTFY